MGARCSLGRQRQVIDESSNGGSELRRESISPPLPEGKVATCHRSSADTSISKLRNHRHFLVVSANNYSRGCVLSQVQFSSGRQKFFDFKIRTDRVVCGCPGTFYISIGFTEK